MGKLILRKNGLETQFINGEDFSTITPQSNTYVLGFDATTGKLESLDPDGNTIEYGTGSGSGSTFTGGTVPAETTFENGINVSNGVITDTIIADIITVQTISAATYLNITAGGIIETTYSELVSLISTSGLTKGSHYLITDFRTCYDQPDFDYNDNPILTGNYRVADVEPLLVFAVSEFEISDNVLSPLFPKDKIKYDYTFNQTEVTSGATYGRITERIDDNGNRTDYDHRNILFKRYNSYFLDYQINGRITSVNGTSVTGYLTDFITDLTVGDVIFIPTPGSQGNGFYSVTNINSSTSLDISGKTYYNYTFNNDEGVLFWRCALDYDNESGTIYYFNDSGTNMISDGGNDMYDNGNSLNTDQYNTIPYTHTQMTGVPNEASIGDFHMDGTVQSGVGYFGSSSNYFTNCYPGLFVMVADSTDVTYFEISGNLGADGSGTYDTYTYSTTVNGNNYTAYAKRVGDDGFDPSVNHIIIVNSDGTGLVHVIGSTTDDDLDRVENLNSNGVTQIHYLLTGLAKGVMLTDEQIDCMVDTYLSLIDGNDINTILSTLNSSYSDVTSCLPDRAIVAASYDYKESNVFENTGYTETLTFENVSAINTYIGDFTKYRSDYGFEFILSNNIFGNIINNRESYNNTIGDVSYNNTFGGNFNNNKLIGSVQNNICHSSFYNNTLMNEFRNNRMFDSVNDNEIGSYFTDNITINDFYRNDIGNDFDSNVIARTFQNNEIGNSFNDNVISDNFYKNDVGNGFNGNRFYGQFYGNLIGNAFNDNRFLGQFYENMVGEYFESNILLGDFYSNKILKTFYNNTIGDQFYENVVGDYFENNVIADYFNMNNIKNHFINNDIGNNFESNDIGNFFGNSNSDSTPPVTNVISDDFRFNKIGNYFGNDTNYPGATNPGGNGGNVINLGFQYNVFGDNVIYNLIGSDFTNNKVGDNFWFNSFGDTSRLNNFGDYFVGNTGDGGFPNQINGTFTSNNIGNFMSYNTIDNDFEDNQIGHYFGNSGTGGTENKIYSQFRSNKIGNYFGFSGPSAGGNTIYSPFYNNLIGDSFYSNYIGENSRNYDFYRNDIGNDFRNNIIYLEFQNNEIGNQFNNNTCGGDFLKNTIGHGFNNNKLFYFDTNKIGNGFNGNILNYDFYTSVIGDYFSNNRFSSFNNNKIGSNVYSNRLGDGFGFYDLSDITVRTYSVFRNSLTNNIGSYIIGRELIMYDTISNEYHKVVFTKWTQGGAGGGFKYTRQLIWPTTGSQTTFERPDYSPLTTDVIVPGVLEIKRDDNGGGIYNVISEGSFNGSVSPINTTWNSNFTSPKPGNTFTYNLIGDAFYNNHIIGSNFSFNDTSNGSLYNSTNISDNFRKNTIGCLVGGYDFSTANFVYNNYNCNVFENSNSIIRLSYYDSSDVLNITDIDA